jgi:DNA-binding NarL/FixJ family response regulator
MSATISVAVIEDDVRLGELLRLLLDGTPGYRCAAVFESVEEALASMASPPPDVALLDVHLPGMRGSIGVGLLRERFPALQVLMLTVYAEDDLVFEAICNGAAGYLLKRTPPASLLAAITEAHEGGAPMSPEIARKVLKFFRTQHPSPREQTTELTPQEVRLLRLLGDGHSYESAGLNLGITINTVRKYVRSIYEKLHVHSKAEAVSKAIRAGLI